MLDIRSIFLLILQLGRLAFAELSFTPELLIGDVAGLIVGVCVVDVDRDGMLDVVVSGTRTSWYSYQGDSFSLERTVAETPNIDPLFEAFDTVIGNLVCKDFTGDSYVDVAFTQERGPPLAAVNNGEGGFFATSELELTAYGYVTAVDKEIGDSQPDYFVFNSVAFGFHYREIEFDSNGRVQRLGDLTSLQDDPVCDPIYDPFSDKGPRCIKALAADIYGSGKPAIVLASETSVGYYNTDAYPNVSDSHVRVGARLNIDSATKFNDFAVADFNNDGRVDIIMSLSRPGAIDICMNMGAHPDFPELLFYDSGDVAECVRLAVPLDTPKGLQMADINADGWVDIVFWSDQGYERPRELFWLANLGFGRDALGDDPAGEFGYPIFDLPRKITSDLFVAPDVGVLPGYAMTDAFGANAGGILDAVISNGSDLLLMRNDALNSPTCEFEGSFVYDEEAGTETCRDFDRFRSCMHIMRPWWSIQRIVVSAEGTHSSNMGHVSNYSCSVPEVAAQICNSINRPNPEAGTFECENNTWRVSGGCRTEHSWELAINQGACTCGNSQASGQFAVRPCQDNTDWGGGLDNTCEAGDQIIRVRCEGAATPAQTSPPSPTPTVPPTAMPTPMPTAAPIPVPTTSPTPMPTLVPTEAPTVVPTPAPTVTPLTCDSSRFGSSADFEELTSILERGAVFPLEVSAESSDVINVTISTCDEATDFDTRLALFKDEDLQELLALDDDDSSCGWSPLPSTIHVEVDTVPSTYYVVVSHLDSQRGIFRLTVACSEPPVNRLPVVRSEDSSGVDLVAVLVPIGLILLVFLAASFVFRHRSRQFVERLFNYAPKQPGAAEVRDQRAASVSVRMNHPTETLGADSISSATETESDGSVEGKPPLAPENSSSGSEDDQRGLVIPGDTTTRDPGSTLNESTAMPGQEPLELSTLKVGESVDPSLRVLVLGDQLVVVDSDGRSTSKSDVDGQGAELATMRYDSDSRSTSKSDGDGQRAKLTTMQCDEDVAEGLPVARLSKFKPQPRSKDVVHAQPKDDPTDSDDDSSTSKEHREAGEKTLDDMPYNEEDDEPGVVDSYSESDPDLIDETTSKSGQNRRKPKQCSVCQEMLPGQRALFAHMKQVHGGLMKHPCPQCGRLFTRKFNMEVHLRTHGDDRPHKCSFCDKSFSQRSNLNRHIKTQHENPVLCPSKSCLGRFASVAKAEEHVKTAHPGEKLFVKDPFAAGGSFKHKPSGVVFSCACKRPFSTIEELDVHRKTCTFVSTSTSALKGKKVQKKSKKSQPASASQAETESKELEEAPVPLAVDSKSADGDIAPPPYTEPDSPPPPPRAMFGDGSGAESFLKASEVVIKHLEHARQGLAANVNTAADVAVGGRPETESEHAGISSLSTGVLPTANTSGTAIATASSGASASTSPPSLSTREFAEKLKALMSKFPRDVVHDGLRDIAQTQLGGASAAAGMPLPSSEIIEEAVTRLTEETRRHPLVIGERKSRPASSYGDAGQVSPLGLADAQFDVPYERLHGRTSTEAPKSRQLSGDYAHVSLAPQPQPMDFVETGTNVEVSEHVVPRLHADLTFPQGVSDSTLPLATQMPLEQTGDLWRLSSGDTASHSMVPSSSSPLLDSANVSTFHESPSSLPALQIGRQLSDPYRNPRTHYPLTPRQHSSSSMEAMWQQRPASSSISNSSSLLAARVGLPDNLFIARDLSPRAIRGSSTEASTLPPESAFVVPSPSLGRVTYSQPTTSSMSQSTFVARPNISSVNAGPLTLDRTAEPSPSALNMSTRTAIASTNSSTFAEPNPIILNQIGNVSMAAGTQGTFAEPNLIFNQLSSASTGSAAPNAFAEPNPVFHQTTGALSSLHLGLDHALLSAGSPQLTSSAVAPVAPAAAAPMYGHERLPLASPEIGRLPSDALRNPLADADAAEMMNAHQPQMQMHMPRSLSQKSMSLTSNNALTELHRASSLSFTSRPHDHSPSASTSLVRTDSRRPSSPSISLSRKTPASGSHSESSLLYPVAATMAGTLAVSPAGMDDTSLTLDVDGSDPFSVLQ